MSGPPWEIKGTANCYPYRFVIVPDHPNAYEHGYVLEHRVVMENHIGRLLRDDEVVHHKNENGQDNRLKNLELKSSPGHKQYHNQKRTEYIDVSCAYCGTKITLRKKYVENRRQGGQMEFFCCRSHSAKYYIERGEGPKRIAGEPVTVHCAYCGKDKVIPVRIYKRKIKIGQTNFYCNRSCMASHQNEKRYH